MAEIIRIRQGVELPRDHKNDPSDPLEETSGKHPYLQLVENDPTKNKIVDIATLTPEYYSQDDYPTNGSSALVMIEPQNVPVNNVHYLRRPTKVHDLTSTNSVNYDISGKIDVLFDPRSYFDFDDGVIRTPWDVYGGDGSIRVQTQYPRQSEEVFEVFNTTDRIVGEEGDVSFRVYAGAKSQSPDRVANRNTEGWRPNEYTLTVYQEANATNGIDHVVFTRGSRPLLPHK